MQRALGKLMTRLVLPPFCALGCFVRGLFGASCVVPRALSQATAFAGVSQQKSALTQLERSSATSAQRLPSNNAAVLDET
jgi:hypothetical protein